MSDFVAGFAPRHAAAGDALRTAFASDGTGFAPADLRALGSPIGFVPQAPTTPKHFSPADPAINPTAGWDPLDPEPMADPRPKAHDPIEAARAAGYAEGMAAASAAAQALAERDRALLTNLAAALREGGAFNRERMARQLRQTVLTLMAKLVGEVGIAPDRLADRIAAATDLLADAAESAMLRVHPDDVPLLDGRLPASVFAVGDAAIARGSFILESASAVVEDGPEIWLEQLAEAVDRVAVPELMPPVC